MDRICWCWMSHCQGSIPSPAMISSMESCGESVATIVLSYFRLIFSSHIFVSYFRLIFSSHLFVSSFRLIFSSHLFVSSFRLIFSSHQIDEVSRLADSVAIMSAGRVLVHCSIEELLGNARRVRAVLHDGRLPDAMPANTIWQRVNRREWLMTVHPFSEETLDRIRQENAVLRMGHSGWKSGRSRQGRSRPDRHLQSQAQAVTDLL
jgi:hypothetical protein